MERLEAVSAAESEKLRSQPFQMASNSIIIVRRDKHKYLRLNNYVAIVISGLFRLFCWDRLARVA